MEWWSIDLERIHYSVTPTLQPPNDLLFPRCRGPGMARPAGKKAGFEHWDAGGFDNEVNAKTRPHRAIARKRGDRRLVVERRRIHRRPFRTRRSSGRPS